MKLQLLLSVISLVLSGYIQVFNDNFQNLNNWVPQVQTGASTGNNEWEYYTSRAANVFTSSTQNGQALILRLQQESYQGYNFTSGKVITKSTWGPYGFFNVKALVPKGNGLWPAIWLLPPNGQSQYGGWAACGEIDVMETICAESGAFATLHFGGQYPNNVQYPNGGNNAYPFTVDWTKPHYFGVEWQPTFMTFWFDAAVVNGAVQGTKINTITSNNWWSENTSGQRYPGNAPFNTPTNIILNLALGGNWPCSVNGCCSNVKVPAQMEVYNVQIWEQA